MIRYLLRLGLLLLDLACLFLAFGLGWWTRFSVLPGLMDGLVSVQQPWSLYLEIMAPAGLLLVIFAARSGLYRTNDPDLRRQVYGSLQAVGWLLPMVLAYLLLFRADYEFSRLGTLFAMGWLLVLLPVARATAFHLLETLGLLRLPTLFVGSGRQVEAYLDSVGRRRHERRNRVVGRFSPEDLFTEDGQDFSPEHNARVERLLAEDGLQKVVVFLEGLPRRRVTTVLRKFEIRVKTIQLVPDAASMALMGARIVRPDTRPLLGLNQNLWRPAMRALKRGLDLAVALAALPLVLLLVALTAPALGFRPLMRVPRRTLDGRPFHLLQLRVDYERGGWLFQSGLYKVPELLGVLAGRQSLVGPAPLIEREVDLYGPNREAFAHVRPGLTGLWQVSDYGYFDPGQRLALDMYYTMNWSPQLDLRILLESVGKALHSLRRPRRGGWRT
jgi:lipopolysaccharide/colanic/teichoic acid biosynthesis glycosyltransferase